MNSIKQAGFLVVLLMSLTTSVAMQVGSRRIHEFPPHKNTPIELVGRQLGDQPFTAEERIWGGSDWLKDLVFDVKNISNKNIIYFEITLLVRKQGRMPYDAVSFSVEFGARMPANGDTPERASRRKFFKPGETLKAKISDSEFSRWTRELEKHEVNDVHRVYLNIREVEFDDKTAWYVGSFLRRDPTGEKMWIPALKATQTNVGISPAWVASLVPLPTLANICANTTTLIPAISRNFFAPTQPPTSECGYFAGNRPYNQSCLGCTDPDDYIGCDRRLDDGLLPNPPAQDPSFGELIDQPDNCRGDENFPTGPPTCNTCPGFVRKTFQSLSGVESCNQVDDDCDDQIDEDDVCCVQGEVPFCDYPSYPDLCLKCCKLSPNGECISPIVLDIDGDGFDLTNAANGVNFDLTADGNRERVGWTAAGSDEVWLALDRNNNSRIDDGSELFGSFTPQPTPPPGEQRNGFLALAEYDKLANGGNLDGVISSQDAIFDRLRLWRDLDHNGRSRNSELFRLPQLGLRKMHLDYETSQRVDQHGNQFRWRAGVKDANDAQLGRWAWDVILVTGS